MALDFRGHGDSGGGYAFGASEHHDFHAVIDELVGQGKLYERFSVLGLSMGGSIAAQALALRPELPCRALAMISSPADLRACARSPGRRARSGRCGCATRSACRGSGPQTLAARKPRASEAVARAHDPEADRDLRRRLARRSVARARPWREAAAPPVEHVHLELPGSLHADGLVQFVPVRLLRAARSLVRCERAAVPSGGRRQRQAATF